MFQLTAIVHPAAQATSQAVAPTDGVTNVAVLLAAGLLVVVVLRPVRVVPVIRALTTVVAALGPIVLLSVALLALFGIVTAAHLVAR